MRETAPRPRDLRREPENMEDSCHDRVATKRWEGTGAEDSMSASPQIAEQSSASYRRDRDLAGEGSLSSITAVCGSGPSGSRHDCLKRAMKKS